MEVLHTFGLCLLVFRALPMFDMMRGLLVLGSIYVIPAMLKAIFEGSDKSLTCQRKFISSILNIGVVMIQLASIVGCCIFGISMTMEEKLSIQNEAANQTAHAQGTVLRPPLINQPRWLWEIPVALICISLSYWENFVDGDLSLFGCTVRFQSWKKYLHHCRPRIYIIASLWKIGWVIGFAKLLQPGFNFNLTYSNSAVTETSVRNQETSVESNVFNPFEFSGETIEHFEIYGILYIQVISILVMTYCASTACKMCMQIFGFSLPLILSTPVSATVIVLQCMYRFLPTGVFVWVCQEEDGDLWVLHLVWLVVLWLSELFVVSHIWFPNSCRMEKTDR